jgi:hypothetical protein
MSALELTLEDMIQLRYEMQLLERTNLNMNNVTNFLNSLGTTEDKSDENCIICLDDIPQDTNIKLPCCGKEFCKPCISTWLVTTPACPHCRHRFNLIT